MTVERVAQAQSLGHEAHVKGKPDASIAAEGVHVRHVIGADPSARSIRVTAISAGISRVQPYFTLILRPSASRQSNFGVVDVGSLGMNVHVVKWGSRPPVDGSSAASEANTFARARASSLGGGVRGRRCRSRRRRRPPAQRHQAANHEDGERTVITVRFHTVWSSKAGPCRENLLGCAVRPGVAAATIRIAAIGSRSLA